MQKRIGLTFISIYLFLFLPKVYAQSCGIADSVQVLDQHEKKYLVYRISGFQDKVESFEIYDGRPQFDQCGKSLKAAIADDIYEPTKGFIRAIAFKRGNLKLLYTKNKSKSVEPRTLKLSR